MKRLFTADIHFSGYGQDKLDDETGLPERLASIKKSLYFMADYCLANNIPEFIFGGDLMHNKSIVYTIAQKIMTDFIMEYNRKIKFHFINGNHDLSGKGTDVISSLEFIKLANMDQSWEWNSHLVLYEASYYNDMYFVPYSHKMVDEIKKNEKELPILISHFGLSEGVLNSGISIVSKLNAQDLIDAGYKLVLLGHYHKPQELINDKISIYYVGSPIQLDWGEKGDEKRFLVFDDETLEVESIPIEGYKKHLEFVVTEENKDKILQEAREARDHGHAVKLYKKDKVNTKEIDKEFLVIDKSEKDITNRGISLGMSEEDRFKKYLEIHEIAEEDHSEYMNEAKFIVGEMDETS